MPLSLELIRGPFIEPVTLLQAKQQCVVDPGNTADDGLLTGYIVAARRHAEAYAFRAFFNQQWVRTLDHFPLWFNDGTVNPAYRKNWPYYSDFWNRISIDIPKPSTQELESVTYVDQNGVLQTLSPSAYYCDLTSKPARLVPSSGNYWPTTLTYAPGSVRIAFRAGSYDRKFTDMLTVEAGPYNESGVVVLSQAARLEAGLSYQASGFPVVEPDAAILTSPVWLKDSNGAPVPFTIMGGILSVDPSYIGATVSAVYFAGTCPMEVQQAILLLVSHQYSNRDATSQMDLKDNKYGAERLLDDIRLEVQGYRPCD
jgi:hypothetical protein